VHLGTLDLALIIAYFAAMIGIGVVVGARTSGAKDYFLGARDLPWWALLLSIVATETSTVTFLSVPGLAYTGDLTFLQLPMGYVLGRLLVVWLLLPHYCRGDMVSAYDVLRLRFGGTLQRVASLTFLVARSLGGGLRLFLTALVLQKLTGMSVPASVLAVTGATLVYTFFGGMRAVVWTDVLQFVIYLGGAGLAFALILRALPHGLDSVLAVAREHGKLRLVDTTFDLHRPYTLWSGVIGGAFLSFGSHGVDQLIVQRLLAAKNQRQAGLALSLSGVVVLLQFAFFLLLGLALFAFYRAFPPAAAFAQGEAVFRDFLVDQVPSGMLGLLLGAVFAASMSSFSSSLNSSAAALVHDFLLPWRRQSGDSKFALASAKAATVLFAGLEVLVAINGVDDRAVVDQVIEIAALTTGVLLGVFCLGTLTRRVDQRAALIGFLAGIGVDLVFKLGLPKWNGFVLAGPWYGLLGCSATFLAGLLAATVRSRPA
jgi:SSS family transporter